MFMTLDKTSQERLLGFWYHGLRLRLPMKAGCTQAEWCRR